MLVSMIQLQIEIREFIYKEDVHLSSSEKQILLHYLDDCRDSKDEQRFINVLLLTKSLESQMQATDRKLIKFGFQQDLERLPHIIQVKKTIHTGLASMFQKK